MEKNAKIVERKDVLVVFGREAASESGPRK
jgi:hypothetical protein